MSGKELSHLEAQRPVPQRHSAPRSRPSPDAGSEEIPYSECINTFRAWVAREVLLPVLLVLLWNVLPAIIFGSVFYLAHFLFYANPYHTTDGSRPFALLVLLVAFFLAAAIAILNIVGLILSDEYIFGPSRHSLITAKVVSYGLLGLLVVGWLIVTVGLPLDGIQRNYFNLTESK
jgi:hypothetical protein